MDSLQNFTRACDKFGQREVARRINYSPTTVNQVYKGIYPKHKPVLAAALKVFGNMAPENIECPLLGEIHENTCAKYQAWAFAKKVHQDLSYRRVKDACVTCKQGVSDG